jgi:hypothetical protein
MKTSVLKISAGPAICFVALSSLLLCGATSPTSCSSSSNSGLTLGPSNGEIGAAVGIVAGVAVGTVVLVEVNKSHHNLKGCVTTGPDGLTLHSEGNSKVYALTGVPANVKVGDVIKVHGSKSKGQKDSAGDQDFAVEKMNRDYGSCKALLAPPAVTAAASAAP